MAEIQDLFEHLFEQVGKLSSLVYERTSTNVGESFSNMTPKQWLRLVIIVCAYMLLRQYLVKWGMKRQEKAMEKADEDEKKAAMSPNYLRGQVDIPDDSDDEFNPNELVIGPDGTLRKKKEPESAAATAADWGKKARRRQRHVVKQILDKEEERLRRAQEDEEDKDIEEYLSRKGHCVRDRKKPALSYYLPLALNASPVFRWQDKDAWPL